MSELRNALDTHNYNKGQTGSVESLGNDVRSFLTIRETDRAVDSLNDAIVAMAKIAKVMKEADYSTMKPTDAAKTISYLAKMVDEVVRLMEFAKGAPDSRSEVVGLSDLLKVLTQEQFYQLQDWIAAGKAKVVNEPGYQA